MKAVQKLKESRRLHIILLVAVILFVLYNLIGFFALPAVFKMVLIDDFSETYQRDVTIESVGVNPYSLSLTMRGFGMKDPDTGNVFASFEELYINLQAVSLFKWAYVVKELVLMGPYAEIIRIKDNVYNVSDIVQRQTQGAEGGGARFSINNIQLMNGRVRFIDRSIRHEATVKDIDLTLPFISNLDYYADIWVVPSFRADVRGAPVSFEGKAKPFATTRDTFLDVDIDNLDISYFLPFIPSKLNFKVPSGFMDLNSTLEFSVSETGHPSLAMSGSARLNKFQIMDREGVTVISVPAVDVSIASLDPIKGRVLLSRATVHGPQANVWLNRSGELNLMSLVEPGSASESAGGGTSRTAAGRMQAAGDPFLFGIDELHMFDGSVTFADYSVGETFRTTLHSLEMTAKDFTTAPDARTSVELAAQTEAGESLRFDSNVSLQPFTARGTVQLAKIPLRKYAPYYSDQVLFTVESGSLSAETQYQFTSEGRRVVLSDLSAAVDALRLEKQGEPEPFLSVPALTVKGGSIDFGKRSIGVDALSTRNGMMLITRLPNGELNLQNLITAASEPGDGGGEGRQKGAGAGPWHVELKNGQLRSYTLKAADLAASPPVSLTMEQVDITVQNVTTARKTNSSIAFSSRLIEGGTASVSGSIGLDPIVADLQVNLEGIDITPFRPYMPRNVSATITSGFAAASGKLTVDSSTRPEATVSYAGDVAFSDVSSIDQIENKPFMGWRTLSLKNAAFDSRPLFLNVPTAEVDGFTGRVWIGPDGTINLMKVLGVSAAADQQPDQSGEATADPGAAAETAPKTQATTGGEETGGPMQPPLPLSFRVEHVVIRDAAIDFTDRHVQPNFQAELNEISGDIFGLSSEKEMLADVNLQGRLGPDSPFKIQGKVNPVRPYVELTVDFDNISVPPMSPYAAKYVGYTITKGKLSMALKYEIVQSRLDAQNNLVFNELTLGRRVESPTATTLPVKFAISLLTDREGVMRLDIPVKGDISNPEFSFSQVIVNTIKGLITKIAASPFSFLASIFPEAGEELNYVVFDHGSAEITPDAAEKLEELGKILYERPKLELEIEGHVSPRNDAQALKEELLAKSLERLASREAESPPDAPPARGSPPVAENDRYLKALYAREFPGGPQNLTPEQMREKLLGNIQITNAELRAFARTRASIVQQYLVRTGKISPERLFVVEPQELAPPEANGIRESRVILRLRT